MCARTISRDLSVQYMVWGHLYPNSFFSCVSKPPGASVTVDELLFSNPNSCDTQGVAITSYLDLGDLHLKHKSQVWGITAVLSPFEPSLFNPPQRELNPAEWSFITTHHQEHVSLSALEVLGRVLSSFPCTSPLSWLAWLHDFTMTNWVHASGWPNSSPMETWSCRITIPRWWSKTPWGGSASIVTWRGSPWRWRHCVAVLCKGKEWELGNKAWVEWHPPPWRTRRWHRRCLSSLHFTPSCNQLSHRIITWLSIPMATERLITTWHTTSAYYRLFI
jgi:hypothetical protein